MTRRDRAIRHPMPPYLAMLWIVLLLSPPSRAEEIDYNAHIRPIFAQHCLDCHGPDESNNHSDFRIDNFADATAPLGDRAGIVPGKPEASVVLHRVVVSDPDTRMPPPDAGDRLSPPRNRSVASVDRSGCQVRYTLGLSPD